MTDPWPRHWMAGPHALLEATRRMVRAAGGLSRLPPGRQAPPIAESPADQVWRAGKATLSRYRPTGGLDQGDAGMRRLGPVVIVHGLIGRQTMLDLEPKRSLVRRLLLAGTDVWVIDWGCPTRADRWCDTTDYAAHAIGDALEAIAAYTPRRPVLFGVCQGGVFAACHAALNPDRLSGLALAVTPIDFHADIEAPAIGRGQLNHWLRALPEGLLDALIADRGNIPGELTAAVFHGLAPGRWMARYTADLAEIADDPEALDTFLRMERWLADRPDQPGALAREWMIGLYRENRLVRGLFEVDGARVDLGRIACPVINIYARDDHIVPPPCSTALKRNLRNVAYTELEVPTGHVGAFVSKRAQGIVAPAMVDWLETLT
ncbi:MAG: alpha/beta fold hydrolase [Pseudomonadota bacterium]